MSSPRIRRLQLDYQRLTERFQGWDTVLVSPIAGDPPDQYQIVYRVRGLAVGAQGVIEERDEHVVEISLGLDYPRRAPQCKIVSPIFHPNFDATTVCIGDFWAASEGLDDLIIRIGRMIAYQEHNTKSPLNGLAAKWAAEHSHLLPVDSVEIAPPAQVEFEQLDPISIAGEQAPEPGAQSQRPPPIPSGTPEEQDEASVTGAEEDETSVKLAPELTLIYLKVRCESCGFEFGMPLSAVEAPISCPNCRKEHKLATTFKCHVIESAGLFWLTHT